MTDREDRIREIAYFLWLDEGCPEGEAERHWSMAEATVDSEPLERKRLEGEPPGEALSEVSDEASRSTRSGALAGFSVFVAPAREGRARVSLSICFLFPML